MARSSFSIGEHIGSRRHLLTDENVGLFDKLEAAWTDGSTPRQRHELRCKIATAFQIPNERRQSRIALHNLMSNLRTVIVRLKVLDEKGLSEGAMVVFTADEKRRQFRIRKIQRDFSLRLEGYSGSVHPKYVQLKI